MSDSRGRHVQLASGRPWYPSSPRPEDVNLDDIAHALARVCRFGGHCRRFYSVAEHSLHCARVAHAEGLSPALQLEALLHDAHEAYPPGDMLGPTLYLLPDARAMSARAEEAVRKAFALPPTMSPEIRTIDLRMLETERLDLLAPGEVDFWSGKPAPEPYGCVVDFDWYERSNDLAFYFARRARDLQDPLAWARTLPEVGP